MSIAPTIAAYIVASHASRSNSSSGTRTSAQKTGSSNRYSVYQGEGTSTEDAAHLAEKAGWVLESVDFEWCYGFRWYYYFTHRASGRVWDTRVSIDLGTNVAIDPTEEQIKTALTTAWARLYGHLRGSELDDRW